jgi:hypothetical protein
VCIQVIDKCSMDVCFSFVLIKMLRWFSCEEGKVERDEIDLGFCYYVYFLLFSHVNNIQTLLILMATLTLFIK